MPITTVYDPVTGAVTAAEERIDTANFGSVLLWSMDYDTDGTKDYQTHEAFYRVGTLDAPILDWARVVYDDGSSYSFQNILEIGLANVAHDIGDREIATDALGRLDYVTERFTYRQNGVTRRDVDYTAGQADYIATGMVDGRILEQDLDPASGRVDYAVERFTDGHYLTTDYDLKGEYPWDAYSVSWGADGSVQGVWVA